MPTGSPRPTGSTPSRRPATSGPPISFERCDTDGFLSQWASGITGQLNSLKADLARNFGLIEIDALFNLDGTVASTHNADGQYGEYWVLNDDAAERFGKRFFSPSKANSAAKRSAADRKKGFTIGTVRVAGYAKTWAPAGARGLGGCTQVSVRTFPVVDELRVGNYEVLSTDDTDARIEREAERRRRDAEFFAALDAREESGAGVDF